MDDEMKASLTAGESWVRGLYMLLFALIYSVAELVLTAVAILQFLFLLIARGPNVRLQEFGHDLSLYFYQIIQFLTFNTEEKPFPFTPWPHDDADAHPVLPSMQADEPEDTEDTPR